MEHRPAEQLEWRDPPGDNFTGRVWFGPVTPEPGHDDVNVLGVLFSPGARTDWHSHPGGQVLYVVSGAGRVGTQAGEIVEMSAGDSVVTPPGEVHWHGASRSSYMMHLSITHHGDTQWTGAKVADRDYDA